MRPWTCPRDYTETAEPLLALSPAGRTDRPLAGRGLAPVANRGSRLVHRFDLDEAVARRQLFDLERSKRVRGTRLPFISHPEKLHRRDSALPGAAVDDHGRRLAADRREAFHRDLQQPAADHVGPRLRAIREMRVAVDEHRNGTRGRRYAFGDIL